MNHYIDQNKQNWASVEPEMRLISPDGERLYLTADERERFMSAVRRDHDRNAVIFATLLHYTGARPTELRELTVNRINVAESTVMLRSLKKRKHNSKGQLKQPHYRVIPILDEVMTPIALAFDILGRQASKTKAVNTALLFPSPENKNKPIDAVTAYRWTKRSMVAAGIEGKKATSKGLRHGFGIHCVTNGLPLDLIQELLGHSNVTTTMIYTRVLGDEKKSMVLNTWK